MLYNFAFKKCFEMLIKNRMSQSFKSKNIRFHKNSWSLVRSNENWKKKMCDANKRRLVELHTAICVK